MYTIDLSDKIVLLTGSDGGLGLEILTILLQAGATVLVTGRAKPEKSIKILEEQKRKAYWYQCDISDQDEVDRMFNQIHHDFKSIDILINNAGIRNDSLLVNMNNEQWDNVIDINLKGTFLCTQAAVKMMLRAKKPCGKVISIASIAGIYGNPSQTNYAASKAGIIAMTKTWAKEYGRKNFTFNVIAPGLTESPMIAELRKEYVKKFTAAVPLGYLAKPSDIAKVVLFLSSSLSDYVNGATINVDGGAVI